MHGQEKIQYRSEREGNKIWSKKRFLCLCRCVVAAEPVDLMKKTSLLQKSLYKRIIRL
jgi:hypothetical protein